MKKSRNRILVVALALGVAGCSSTDWLPGPDAHGTLEEAAAQCRLGARHTGGSFYVQGSEKFVAEASAGYAAGRLVGIYLDFNDCMEANGWVPADKSQRAAYYAQAPVPVASASVQDDVSQAPPHCTKEDYETADLAKKQGYQYHLSCAP